MLKLLKSSNKIDTSRSVRNPGKSIFPWGNHDYIITLGIILLALISLILVYSTTYKAKTVETGAGTFSKQILFFIMGFFIYFIISGFSLSWIKTKRIFSIVYLITILLLIYVKFLGSDISNTNRWITILGFNIQPAEYAKITLIIITAAFWGIREDVLGTFVEWNKSGKKNLIENIKNSIYKFSEKFPELSLTYLSVLSLLPIIILVFIQPALGNSIIILFIWAAVIFAASKNQLKLLSFFIPIILISLIKWKIISINFLPGFDIPLLQINIIAFLAILLISSLLFIKTKLNILIIILSIIISFTLQPLINVMWESDFISNYQKERIETFFQSPENDPLDAGYQVKQAKIAIGSGQFWGRGYLKGTQSSLQVLPFAHTDFIFAALAEQFGLFGVLILFLIYLTILIRILIIAIRSNNEFSFLICIGITVMILLNIFINAGMNMGSLPVTGIPLPLVSYGGSSVLVNMIGLGLVQSTLQDRKLTDVSQSFSWDLGSWR